MRQRREAERKERERQELRNASFGAYFRLMLTLCLAFSIAAWPYSVDCGVSLWGYLTAVVVLVCGGVWTAVGTWTCRGPWRHGIALMVILWGLGLGAAQILPRVGYAAPSQGHSTTWSCMAE